MSIRLRVLSALAFAILLNACSPTLRFKPGEVPAATPPEANLKTEAEGYVKAHIDEENYREVTSGADLARVKNVVQKLSVAAGYSRNQFPVHLIDAGDLVNAAAVNGASIMVYQELLRRVRNDTELAAVLGHEIGHILAKHYKDQQEEQDRAQEVGIGSSIIGAVASIATSAAGYGGASDLAGSVAETTTSTIGYGVYVGSFSRTQEYEADHLGLIIMARAGYDPNGAIELWKRSEEVFGSADSSVGAFFSTHPASGDRIDQLVKTMPYAEAERPGKKKA